MKVFKHRYNLSLDLIFPARLDYDLQINEKVWLPPVWVFKRKLFYFIHTPLIIDAFIVSLIVEAKAKATLMCVIIYL